MTGDLGRAMEAEAARQQGQIVSLLLPLIEARQAKNEATKVDLELGTRVKQYLELHRNTLDHDNTGRPTLEDDEHGILAYLMSSRETSWNVSRMPDELVVWLARAGLLTVATTAFDQRKRNDPDTHLDDALGYRTEGEKSVLRVVRVVQR